MARIIVGGEPSDFNLALPLYAQVVQEYGARQVFSVASLTSGEDYHEAFERELGSCLTLVVLVGPSWRDGVPPRTQWLLERATARDVTTILVAVGGATAIPSIESAVSSLSARNKTIRTLDGSDPDVVGRVAMEVRAAEVLQQANDMFREGRVGAGSGGAGRMPAETNERTQEIRRQVEAMREQRRSLEEAERRQEEARHRAELEDSRRRAAEEESRRRAEEEYRRRAEEEKHRRLAIEERARAEAERQAAEEQRVEMERRARAAAEEEYRRALETLAAERRRRDEAAQQSREKVVTGGAPQSEPARPVQAPPPPPSSSSPTVLYQPAPASTAPTRVSLPQQAPASAPSLFARFKDALGGLAGSLFTRKAVVPLSDAVQCTVFAPADVQPANSVLVQVFAHLPEDEAKVRQAARGHDPSADARGAGLLTREVERGTRLTFSLHVAGATVDDPVQELSWRGSIDAVQFGVTVPATLTAGNLIGTVTVSDGSVPIGRVKFVMSVVQPGATTLPDARARQSWRRYEHAFVSYASSDRDEVLKRVQMLRRLHIDVFQDVLSLEPGERWKKALYKHIDESDVFFLFWSSAAKKSEWVLKEVRYAMDRHNGNELAPPEIVPVIIEGPPPVPPPEDLADLHFNDPVMYFVGR